MFSTQEVLKIAKVTEKATADKSTRIRRRKRPVVVEIEEQENEPLKSISSNSESDCIMVQSHKMH